LLSPLNEEPNLLVINDLAEPVKEDSGIKMFKVILNESPLTPEAQPLQNIEVPQPEIIVEHKSGSDSSLDHYFPKTESQPVEVQESKTEITSQPVEVQESKPAVDITEENKSGFKSLLDQIRLKRNDKDVTATPSISNVGLQTPIQERLSTSPLLPNPSVTNLFEETMNLFDDNPIDTGIDTSGESSNKEIIKGESLDPD
jgi:hypothetical protein